VLLLSIALGLSGCATVARDGALQGVTEQIPAAARPQLAGAPV